MILFEKFGDDYDEIVNQMSHAEKLKLKQEVDKKTETSMQESEKNGSVLPDVIPTSPDMIPPSPPIPKPRTRTPVKPLEKNKIIQGRTDVFSKPNINPTLTGKYFKSPMSLKNSPNYLRPTTASKMRMSPRKKDVFFSNPAQGAQTSEPEACPRAGFVQSSTVDFVPKNSKSILILQLVN